MYKRRMENPQYLYPEAIYQLSRILQEIWDLGLYPENVDRVSKPLVITALFSSHSRTVHWTSVASTCWKFKNEENENISYGGPGYSPPGKSEEENLSFDVIRQIIKSRDWDEYVKIMRSYESHTVDEALRCLESLKETNSSVADTDKAQYHRALLHLFESYHLHPKLYLDGIIYRNLIDLHDPVKEGSRDCLISYVVGRLMREQSEARQRYSWVDLRALGKRNGWAHIDLGLKRYQCQETDDGSINATNDINDIQKKLVDENPYISKGWIIQTKLLNTLLLDAESGAQGKGTLRDYLICVPIYDAWLGLQPWGNLCGNVLLLFKKEEECQAFECGRLRVLIDNTRRFSEALGRSALSTILAQPLWDEQEGRSYDLVEHFVRQIIWLQDWERIIVYRKKGDTTYEPQYCYQRVANGDGIRTEWERCHHKKNKDNAKDPDCQTKKWESLNGYLRWEQDLWNEAFLPDLSDEERSMYGGIHLAGEYPRAAVIPSDQELRKALDDYYIRQQIEVLRGLAPKVRARRSALRTAAVTIMSRNMSHNIGSHVLSRIHSAMPRVSITPSESAACSTDAQLNSKIQEQLEKACAPLTRFTQYLEERMDFLADVATSFPLAALSLDIKKDFIDPFSAETVLLKRISGTEKSAEVKLISTSTYRVASPGGQLGTQAFFVLLENVIRNTAKHSPSDGDTVLVKIDIRDDRQYNDLYKVIVWDQCSTGKQTRERNGETIPLYKYLNEAIATPLISESGEVEGEFWGLREMTIAAAYLRKIKLEELEQQVSPSILEAVLVDDEGKENQDGSNLGYRFYLLRAKSLAVVSRDSQSVQVNLAELRRNGIDFFLGDECQKQALSGGLEHEMMLWLTPDAKQYAQHRTRLPIRILVPTGNLDSILGWVKTDTESHVQTLEKAGALPVVCTLWDQWKKQRFADAKLYHAVDATAAAGVKPAVAHGNNKIGERILVKPDSATPDNGEQPVIYDHHGGLHRKRENYQQKCLVHGTCDAPGKDSALLSTILFWEPYKVGEPISSVLDHPPEGEEMNQIVAAQLIEAGCTTVVIMDERVQRASEEIKLQYGYKGQESEFVLRDLLSGMSVLIPPKNGQGLDLEKEPDLQALEGWLGKQKSERKKIDFWVIHQGIIDRLFRLCARKSESMAHWLECVAKANAINEVVVCSGRGRPSGLPDDVRFIPLSSVLKWTVQRKSKYHLCQLLYGSRRVSK